MVQDTRWTYEMVCWIMVGMAGAQVSQEILGHKWAARDYPGVRTWVGD